MGYSGTGKGGCVSVAYTLRALVGVVWEWLEGSDGL